MTTINRRPFKHLLRLTVLVIAVALIIISRPQGSVVATNAQPQPMIFETLYRVTNSPYDTEWVGGISVSDEFGRIVFHTGASDIWSFSFEVPRPPATQVSDLIEVVRSFNLPAGLESRRNCRMPAQLLKPPTLQPVFHLANS